MHIHGVKKGYLGGYIEKLAISPTRITHRWPPGQDFDNALVFDEARVLHHARVYGKDQIQDKAIIIDRAYICGTCLICEHA